MASKDEDTLPLPGFSQELSIDATVDEDFIPTSQPQSVESIKTSKNSDPIVIKSTENPRADLESRIEDTLPSEDVINRSAVYKGKSSDFIPDSETKNKKTSYISQDFSCKKKLDVFEPESVLRAQSNAVWDSKISKIHATLDSQNSSVLQEFVSKKFSWDQDMPKSEESVTEILVNDSSDTIDLETTPVPVKKSNQKRISGEKLEVSCRSTPDLEKCGETQVFDNSSVLALDRPEISSQEILKNEGISGVTSEKFYVRETVNDGPSSSENTNGFSVKLSPPHAKVKGSEEVRGLNIHQIKENSFSPQEIESDSASEHNPSSVVIRKVDFKLTVTCFITFNTKTNKIVQKIISKVNEIPKAKPKAANFDPTSDNTSEQSKRFSTSSSSSVYSDKTGLPFALPKRVSAVSDLTDSSEDDIGALRKQERKAIERVPWSNEYLLALTMDDIMNVWIENQEFLKRPNVISSPRNPRGKSANHLKKILEKSASDLVSLIHSVNKEEELINLMEKENKKNSAIGVDDQFDVERDEKEGKRSQTEIPEVQDTVTRGNKKEAEKMEEKTREESKTKLCDGSAVFARWTDKRYYSGVLCGSGRNDRWDVKFDDGTSKTIREDFIMPVEWLSVGSLVFALIDDKYMSGQITNIKHGKEVVYVVELDMEKKEFCVKMSDLCLTDVMAGIVKEKYRPLTETPRATADIDFDNVISGRRLREQRTPLKPSATNKPGNSGAKKKSSSKTKKAELKSIKETPRLNKKKTGGLKSENGHLVEDKVISAESPSGNEAVETPLRGSSKESKTKVKPRTLSYEAEETRARKSKCKTWLAPDGTPIPGPSGVKTKKRKTKEPVTPTFEDPDFVFTRSMKKSWKVLESVEKGRRKRKLNESSEENVQKKSSKTRTRKG